MTPPIETKWYLQTGAWATRRADNSKFLNAGITGGINLRSDNGYYVNGEAGVGYSALRGQVKLGKDINIGNVGNVGSFGIGVSASAESNYQFKKSTESLSLESKTLTYQCKSDDEYYQLKYYANSLNNSVYGTVATYSTDSFTNEFIAELSEEKFERAYNSCDIKFAGRVEGIQNFKKGQVRFGVEAGYQNDINQAKLDGFFMDRTYQLTITNADDQTSEVLEDHSHKVCNPKASGWYVSPTLSVDVNLNKSGNLKARADMSNKEISAGINLVF